MFSRNVDPNEFWIALLEKAYAKYVYVKHEKETSQSTLHTVITFCVKNRDCIIIYQSFRSYTLDLMFGLKVKIRAYIA